MKISIVTGVWKRPEVFKIFAQGIKNIPYDIRVIVAGSEGIKSRRMVLSEGFEYIEHKNNPLADKMNATTMAAKGSDYVICMGSDDIISPELFNSYLKYMELGYDFIGVEDLYFYDLESKRALYWGGYRERYRKGATAGTGRCISKQLMNEWDWKPWKREHSKYLDNSMEGRIKGKKKIINLKESGLMALDIKSKVNMTPFKRWDNSDFIDSKIITEKFPYIV